MIKPEKVLCKRTYKYSNHQESLIEGVWYNVVYNESDTDKTFSIIDSQGNRHLHYMYTEEDKKDWPDICTMYGPRDYSKWFYTPIELRRRKIKAICTR